MGIGEAKCRTIGAAAESDGADGRFFFPSLNQWLRLGNLMVFYFMFFLYYTKNISCVQNESKWREKKKECMT